jgi:hypothetical protein
VNRSLLTSITLGAVATLMVATAPAQSISAQSRSPVFDPTTFGCVNSPPVMVESTVPGTWQVSAPRGWPGPTRSGETIEVGLRDKFGGATRSLDVTATIIRPDGNTRTAQTTLRGSTWAYLTYPRAFGGELLTTGTYTVSWETPQGFVACDGFVVSDS